MKSIVAWSGWGVCAVLVVAVVVREQWLKNEYVANRIYDDAYSHPRVLPSENVVTLEEIIGERDAALDRVTELELALAEKNEIEVIGEEAEDEEDAKNDSDKSERSEAQQQMMEVQASAITEMLYADLFMELGLDGDMEASVTTALVDRMLGQMDTAQAALKAGDMTAREVFLQQEALKAETYAALREVLDRETMAAFEEYDANRDSILLEKTVAPQIAQFSSGLTDENRGLVEHVVLEELSHYQNVFNQSDTLFTLGANADWQIEAMESIQSQLGGVLDEQQMGEVNRWIDLGMRSMEALKKQ